MPSSLVSTISGFATIPPSIMRLSRGPAALILDAATMEDPILEFLRSQARNYRCRVCGSNHKGSQLRKIGNHNNKLIVQVTCGRCRDSFFLHVEIDGDPLTHDEVLDAHQRLAAFQGKLTELLED